MRAPEPQLGPARSPAYPYGTLDPCERFMSSGSVPATPTS